MALFQRYLRRGTGASALRREAGFREETSKRIRLCSQDQVRRAQKCRSPPYLSRTVPPTAARPASRAIAIALQHHEAL